MKADPFLRVLRAIAVLTVFMHSLVAFSDDFRRDDIFLSFGSTIGAKSNVSGTLNASNLPTQNSSDAASGVVALDVLHRFTPYFGGDVVLQYLNYPGSGGSPSDTQLFIGGGPRGSLPLGDFEVWGSVVAGITLDFFGQTRSVNNGLALELTTAGTTGFQYGPRIGVDYDLKHLVKFRIEVDYSRFSYSQSFNVSNSQGQNVGSGNFQVDESYLSAMIGAAWEF